MVTSFDQLSAQSAFSGADTLGQGNIPNLSLPVNQDVTHGAPRFVAIRLSLERDWRTLSNEAPSMINEMLNCLALYRTPLSDDSADPSHKAGIYNGIEKSQRCRLRYA